MGKKEKNRKLIKFLRANKEIFIFLLIGAAFGYLFLSPFTMVIADRLHGELRKQVHQDNHRVSPFDSIKQAFRQKLFIWSLIYVLFGAAMGILIGMYLKMRRRLLRKLEENYVKLKNLEKMKDSLIHMIVHDLNNPLMVLSGTMQLFELDFKDILTGEQKTQFNTALLAGKEMSDMISNLLDISKMEEEKLKLKHENISIASLIRELVGFMDMLAVQKNIRIITNIAQDMPVVVADREIIKRVISNLIGNALKFAPPKSSIDISADYNQKDKSIFVSVADHGQGIPPEYVERVFDKFVQVEDKRFKGKLGKGLGLAFCKMAVEAHGGKIWAESVLGESATFSILLPLNKLKSNRVPDTMS